MIDDLPEMVEWVKGEELLLGVAGDFALRQCFLKFSNLCLGKVWVVSEIQRR